MSKVSVFLICLLCIACKETGEDTYPKAVQDNFMNNCLRTSGNDKQLCHCMLKSIESEYSYAEFTSIEAEIETGKVPEEFTNFIQSAKNSCVKN